MFDINQNIWPIWEGSMFWNQIFQLKSLRFETPTPRMTLLKLKLSHNTQSEHFLKVWSFHPQRRYLNYLWLSYLDHRFWLGFYTVFLVYFFTKFYYHSYPWHQNYGYSFFKDTFRINSSSWKRIWWFGRHSRMIRPVKYN